tara:strand:- start:2481 stop:3443 length:963 start_codon:yes stop_codon:yes gene_type:complete
MSAGINQAIETMSNLGNTFVDSYQKGLSMKMALEQNRREQRKQDLKRAKELQTELISLASINPDLVSSQVEAYKSNPETQKLLKRLGWENFEGIYDETKGLQLINPLSTELIEKKIKQDNPGLTEDQYQEMTKAATSGNQTFVAWNSDGQWETMVKEKPKDTSFKDIQSLRKEANNDPVIKDSKSINSAVSRMDNVWENYKKNPGESKNALDQALVITFNKMMDPGSVVRESEYARTPQGQSLISRMVGFAEKIKEGGVGLTDKEREEIVKISKQLQEGHNIEVQKIKSFYENEAIEAGLDPTRIFGREQKPKDDPLAIF